MKNTKNQQRMETLETVTSRIRKLHDEIRGAHLTHREQVGLTQDVNDLVVAAEALQQECRYRPKPWNDLDTDSYLDSLPGHAESQRG